MAFLTNSKGKAVPVHAPAAYLRETTSVPLNMRLGEPQIRSGRTEVDKTLMLPSGFQPVVVACSYK